MPAKRAPGAAAPDFALASTAGGTVSLASLRGARFVLYFYPADDTPGCTKEACGFRESWSALRGLGVAVYGVSPDPLGSHAAFRAKHGLPFPLLTDPDNEVARAYGAFGEKVLYGRKVVGCIRSTFLVGADGRLEKVWSPVRGVEEHAAKVLEAAASAGEPPVKPRRKPKA